MNNKNRARALICTLWLGEFACVFAQDRPGQIIDENGRLLRAPVEDAAPEPNIKLTPSLTLGGRYDTKYNLEENFNLDDADDEDEVTLEPELTLSLSYAPNDDFEAFASAELKREYAFDVSEESESDPLSLQLTETYLKFHELFEIAGGDVNLQVGRQRFDDEREWLYDERLDGARFFYELSDHLTFELSATRQTTFDRDLLNDDDRDKINNYFLYGLYELDNEMLGDYEIDDLGLAAYVFKRDDLTADDEDPIFIGIQAYGEVIDDLVNWLELAQVRGHDGDDDIRGYAVDVGASYEFSLPLDPSLVLGYAFASGDSQPDDGTDRNFRQTDLQDNQWDIDGNISFRYYGVLMEPELSNLEILTAGVGIKPSEVVTAHLIYHRYRQDEALDELRDTNLDADPNGESRDIGSAIDLVSGVVLGRWALDIEFGYFMPGAAFDEDENDSAFFTELDLKFKF
jgi:alginate production protein